MPTQLKAAARLTAMNLAQVVPLIQDPVKHRNTVSGTIKNSIADALVAQMMATGWTHSKDNHSLIGDFDIYSNKDFKVTLKQNPMRTHITIEVL